MARKQRIKGELIAERGGGCQRCGYNKSLSALSFHHRDRSSKTFNMSAMTSHSEAKVRREAEKCDLLCSNCHHEIEDEFRASGATGAHLLYTQRVAGSNPVLPIPYT